MMQAIVEKGNTMRIDHNAPLTTRKEFFIQASPEAVWQLHTDIHWVDWHSGILAATLEGGL